MINYTIPGTDYRNPVEVQVPYLTDSERQALSYAYLDRQFVVREFKDVSGTTNEAGYEILSGWRDVTPTCDVERHARLREAMISLDRLGLVEKYYESLTPPRERVTETTARGHFRVSTRSARTTQRCGPWSGDLPISRCWHIGSGQRWERARRERSACRALSPGS